LSHPLHPLVLLLSLQPIPLSLPPLLLFSLSVFMSVFCCSDWFFVFANRVLSSSLASSAVNPVNNGGTVSY
jgi:hypothetical protein